MPEYMVEAPFEDRRIEHETSKSRLHLPDPALYAEGWRRTSLCSQAGQG